MIKMLKKAILGLATLAIISPSITAIAEEAATMSAASSANSPLYSVTVPKEINLGELKETNYQQKYSIDIDLLQPELGDVYIESPSSFQLKDGDSKIEVYNTIKNNGVMNTKSLEAIFWVEPTEVYSLSQGTYTGKIDYSFEFRADEYLNQEKGNNISGRSVGMITNGFANIVKSNGSTEIHKFAVETEQKSSGKYFGTAQLKMTKETAGKSENISKVSEIVEVRIPLDTLNPINNSEYKVDDNSTENQLSKLAARPVAGNYTEGSYFSTVDAVYVYTSSMMKIGLYTGPLEDGSYPPDFVPDENGNPDTDGNTGGGSDFAPTITPPSGSNGDTSTDEGGSSGTLVTPDVSSGDGSYTADVSMRKADNINTASMCDSLFFSKADITLKGDNATVTLYVIDPIPLFVEEGTPITNVKYMYKGSTYSANLNSSNKVAKYFGTAAGFINTAGNYYTSKIVATFPKQAIADSTSGALKIEAYVNAVMKSTQEFYVLFGNLTGGSTASATDTSDIIDATDPDFDPYEGVTDESILLDEEEFDTASNSNGLFGGAGSLAEALANGMINFQFSGDTVVGIFMAVLSALGAFFGYAYYLRRKRVMENV